MKRFGSRNRLRRHLRDVAAICPAQMWLSSGYVLNRCELDAGHGGKHKDGCMRWGSE
ncbi:hypothetical protein FHR83_007028 [Actinoplanes campanulatus]|uniref:Uncharacterized protein n=1 Tax=Actinoplanes campanulatus TaxID=113559 RepID=A0A7W5ANL3_9ACTN|nr:hypothetical protein [Actinoplanes campanulatus]MBB3099322.1 hypothetical protein [Actinoplanes campanulatus]GGN40485.1 hypothetical protein GCM10010109_69630 [Actinoplanes campanulatus]GID40640.1 hypothetical protein Aca09nite_71460 [Actinoplanes campanulatus]